MIFKNREEAGRQLIPLLIKYQKQPDTVVIGLPRGGVVNAFEVAKGLSLPLDVVFPRKIGAPHNHELALGAVTETGEGFFNENLIRYLDVDAGYLDQEKQNESKVARKRLMLYRKVCPKINLEEKTVILVDDGLATGATMKAAIHAVKAEGAAAIVVAVPVAPPDTFEEIKEMVDEVVAIDTPLSFQAVGQFYDEFFPVEDETVMDLLRKASTPSSFKPNIL